jgi:GT2 family glycosyltransferase
MKEKIGVGITTCNRSDFLESCYNSIKNCDIFELVIVNDGDPIPNFNTHKKHHFLQNLSNIGVGKSKNKLFRHLLDAGCDHIFIIEDDCIIQDCGVFEMYINAYKETGMPHFNFGPGSPWNRKQNDPSIIGDLSKRHLASQETEPNPKIVFDYGKGLKIALYDHIVGMFSYFHRSILEEVGLYDEEFYNAWEHVEHTYRIIKAGKYTPFWFFADVVGSEKYIKEAKNEKARTTLAKSEEEFMQRCRDGLKRFYELHKTVPSHIPGFYTREQLIEILKKIKNEK